MVADLRDGLMSACAAVQAAASGQSFGRSGVTLSRATSGGMTHVVYFYLSPTDAPPQVGISERDCSDTFAVQLGVRAEGFTRDRQAFPDELDLDVSVGIGATRRRARHPHWSLSERRAAVDDVTRLLNTSGERWFNRFASVDRALETLESLAPEDKTQTWQPPRLVAMRIRAQRGELADARRDLDEHIAQQDGRLTQLDVPYGVTLARALAYGVDIPTGCENYVHLGWAWRATRLINDDCTDTPRDHWPVSGRLDRSSRVPQVTYGGATLLVTGTTEADIQCEVGGFLQREISKERQMPWPLCPTHNVTLDVQQIAGHPTWQCSTREHAVSAIGQLPRVNPGGRDD